jgi:hypothetical protein
MAGGAQLVPDHSIHSRRLEGGEYCDVDVARLNGPAQWEAVERGSGVMAEDVPGSTQGGIGAAADSVIFEVGVDCADAAKGSLHARSVQLAAGKAGITSFGKCESASFY